MFHFKIVLLGEAAVGKTSLVRRYAGMRFQRSYKMTIGTDFYVKKISMDDATILLTVWDLAGQQTFASIRPVFYAGSHGALLVFDITRDVTLTNLDSWFVQLKKHSRNASVVLVGNKADLVDKREVPVARAKEYATSIGCEYIETSAATGKNVKEAFELLVRKILRKQE